MKTGLKRILSLALIIMVCQVSCRKVEDPPKKNNEEENLIFSDCFDPGELVPFEIVSFNVQTFPKNDSVTVEILAKLIEESNVDLIAFQEMSSEAQFNKLADKLQDYTALFYPINNYGWNLAYLIGKDCSITESETKILFQDDLSSFPRPPFEIHITHIPSGIEAVFINNHFKCCGGTDNELRRSSASQKLYDYVNSEYPDTPVVILGDLNDEIDDPVNENVFQIFIDDPDNFMFTDMDIATGSDEWWSYPSYPSHIDHFIITNELYGMLDTTMVLKPEFCYRDYFKDISDHRPVYLRLK